MGIPKPITTRQMREIISVVTKSVPSYLPSNIAREWISDKKNLEKAVGKILWSKKRAPDIVEINWRIVYEALGMQAKYKFAISRLKVANKASLWVIPVLRGLTCKKLILCLKKLGVNIENRINNPDITVRRNDRHPNKDGSYVIAFRRSIEADEDNRNLSAYDMKKKGLKGITLLERLLLELGYFIATNSHLDEESVTLCAGSYHINGDTPRVCFRSGILRVYVCWCGAKDQCDHLRARSAKPGRL